ncbi:MAG: isoprenyl transferase [Clostridia bacterium]|jgi:undecaprenyl diphosphate synthase|nr:isoprenyl transferase [Clostridia bacterium]
MLRLPFFRGKTGVSREKPSKLELSGEIPTHIAIIMDGNGRWAQKRNLPRAAGHRKGVESLRAMVEACLELEVKILTVYAFSTENWKRPKEEVDILMNLLVEYLQKEINELDRQGVRISPIGEISRLPVPAVRQLEKAVKQTAANDRLILNIALNYGGRAEIVNAVKEVARLLVNGELAFEEITEEVISQHLATKDMPDPDLLIRPSGEYRISNFLLWQIAYTEFWITDVLWPDFRKEHLVEAIRAYQKRDRRFGGLRL